VETAVGEVERGKLTVVQGSGKTGKTKRLLEATKQLATEGWRVRYVTCDEHPVTVSKRVEDNPKYDTIEFVQGSMKRGFIIEAINECKRNPPDALVIQGYPTSVNDLRLLQVAAKELMMAVLPTQPRTTNEAPF
jgi:KaiC/GvpD/RAD55 family RecA-like ATPase